MFLIPSLNMVCVRQPPPPHPQKSWNSILRGHLCPCFSYFRWRLGVRWSSDSSPNYHTCFTSETMLRFFTVVSTFVSKRKDLPIRSLAFPAWVQLGSILQRFVLIHLPPYIAHSLTSPLSSLLHTYFVLPSKHKINKF